MEAILIVDDNRDMQFTLSNILKDQGYETVSALNGERAIKEIKKRPFALVLLDMKLPGMDGIKILEEVRQIDKDLIVIMLTAYGDVKDAVRAMRLGAFDYITKPFDNEEMALIIKKALQARNLSMEVAALRKKLGEKAGIEEEMGESPQVKQVLNQVNIIAPTNMTVIIRGESGTGKELVARMIHRKSKRKDMPFIAVDCGAIPETLVESEFFGYEKGAFTGADDRKEGKFEQANGGTMFLDEVANLTDGIQMKLLRIIQEKKVQHLGGKKDIAIDVRIVAATKTDLGGAMRAGAFRDDLYHRLNEFQVNLPPLRARKEDIPVLANHFLKDANNEFNKNIRGFSAGVMKFFLSYDWPGNVREFKNFIKRAALLSGNEYITDDHLSANGPETGIGSGDNCALSFKNATEEFQRKLIKRTLEEVNGSKIKAAKLLKINRKALYRKMQSLSFD